MERQSIQPQKVTQPFQLLAAWLVTLIALDGAFLTGARMVMQPQWIPGMLSIAAVANVPIFLFTMFLLQTRFRAEMQGDEYFSTYVKDSRETSLVASKLSVLMANSGLDMQNLVTTQKKLSDLPQAIEAEIRTLLQELRGQISAQQLALPNADGPEATTILTLAKGLLAEQKWSQAGTAFEQYARYRPDDWETSYARGVAFANADAGDITDISALRAYNDAIAYAPKSDVLPLRTRLFGYRGAILKRLKRLDEAEADLMIAQRNANTDYERQDVAYNLACVYALTGRRVEMLDQIRTLVASKRYLGAVRSHLNDYFAMYKSDSELLKLINVQ